MESLCPLLNNYPVSWLPLSYIVYRLVRTLGAFIWALLLYRLVPMVWQPNLNRFKGRWTVVTGGTDGIGKAYMFELARRGLRKFLLVGRSEGKLQAVREQMESQFPGCRVESLLFDFEGGDFAQLRARLRPLDVGLAVNSVGVGRALLERYGDSPGADAQVLRVNALGAAEFLSCVLPPMESCGGGQLVVLSSSQGVRPVPLLASYSASKSLVSFLSECIHREYSTVDVQCLTPALVATNMTYYQEGSFFVVTAENFAREAVSVLGLTHRTSGCLNHELQMLLRHLLPWTVLKHLIMPIYWRQQRRMLHIQESLAKQGLGEQSVGVQGEERVGGRGKETQSSPPPSAKVSRIPTSSGGVVVRSRA